MWAKGASVVCLGWEADGLPHLSARVPGANSAMAARVLGQVRSSYRGCIFLLQIIFIAKLNLPKPFDYPGDTASPRGYGDLGGEESTTTHPQARPTSQVR